MTARAVRALQIALTHLALLWFRLPVSRRRVTWVVGVDEIAGMVGRVAEVLGDASAIALSGSGYDFRYEERLDRSSPLWLARRIVLGPVLLARAASRARGVVYLGASGFLLADLDQRAWEMRFLRARGRVVICYFVGDDVRAPRLMHALAEERGGVNISTRVAEVSAEFESDAYDRLKRRIAATADAYATEIYSWSSDQRSYLRRPTRPVTYFYPDALFEHDLSKFDDLSRPVIIHAPSAAPLKGTEHVQAAIERLEAEGYPIDYIELQGADNSTVLRELRRAHIALNQFYAYVPGVFGSEAMAACCALLMSADPAMEQELPAEPAEAWIITRPNEVYRNLRDLLDHPDRIRPLAERGQEWATRNVAYSTAGVRFRAELDSILASS